MNDELLLNQLKELAEKLGIEVRYEKILMLKISSLWEGLCRIEGEYMLIVHSRLSVRGKIHLMSTALKDFEIGDIYIRPVF